MLQPTFRRCCDGRRQPPHGKRNGKRGTALGSTRCGARLLRRCDEISPSVVSSSEGYHHQRADVSPRETTGGCGVGNQNGEHADQECGIHVVLSECSAVYSGPIREG